MEQINGFWTDSNNNRWDCDLYSKNQAENANLINCKNCVNCFNCIFCNSCIFCIFCDYCNSCNSCDYCDYCDSCDSCNNFKSNPERITSPKIGSRNSQTTYYWNDEIEQIVFGCFKGTMQEFKDKITATHSDNEHAKAYFEWIKRVENYKI